MREMSPPPIGGLAAIPEETRRWLWIGGLTLASALFRLALACATPFAALAPLAALHMRQRDAVSLIGAAWLANQIVGYGILHYPRTVDSFGWGIAIGAAAVLGLAVARGLARRVRRGGSVVLTATAFIGAFIAYEAALYLASYVLPGSDDAFSRPIIRWLLEINGLAMAGLLALHRLAVTIGLVARRPIGAAATAT